MVCILEKSLQAYINAWSLRHIVCLEKLAKSRDWVSFSDVFQESLITYRGCVYPNCFHLHKHASDAAFSTLCPFIDPDI